LEKHKKYHVPALGGVSVAAQCRHDKAFGFWENWRPNACGAEPIYPERCLFAKYRVIRYVALGFGAWGLELGPWPLGLGLGLWFETWKNGAFDRIWTGNLCPRQYTGL